MRAQHAGEEPAAIAVRLAGDLLNEVPAMTERLVELLLSAQAAYRDLDAEELSEVRRSVHDNLREILESLAHERPPSTAAPLETARRRAEMGVPLGAVLHAYRLGYRVVWEALIDRAMREGAPTPELLGVATELWAIIDTYSEAAHTAYRETLVDRARQMEHERLLLFDALLEGRVEEWSVVGDAARVLDLPGIGPYVAITAEAAAGTGGDGLPRVEQRLRAHAIRSVWRTRADEQVGVVALDRDHPLPRVRELLQEAATARVGLSPPYAKLADTAWAVGLAAVARGSSPPGAATVRGLDDRAIATLVSAGRTVAELVARTVLGPVLDRDPAERALLLENLEAWFDAGGSASEAGHRLYCHRNTVRNRLQRVEQLTGRSTANPQATSELYAALTAVRLLGLAPPGPDQGSG